MTPSTPLPPMDSSGLPSPVHPEWHPQIQLQEPPRSSAVEFLARSTQSDTATARSTPLLQAVKEALRGKDTDQPSSIQTSWYHDIDNPDGREISWNGKQVALSCGGVMIKRWSFFNYKEDVQYACLGMLEQSAFEAQKYFTPAPTTASVSEDDAPWNPSQGSEDDNRPTFGPFAQSQRTSKQGKFADDKKAISAVFVFLRSIGKIYLQNGIDYTINIPFVVRRAWPLSPHGVLVQRVLEASELEEASVTGEPVLPTIFSITSPFQEPAAVGLAARIEGGPGSDGAPLVIHTEDEKSSMGVLTSISPTEMVLWASHGPDSQDIHLSTERNKSLVVTVDTRRKKVSIWAYAYSPDSLPPQPPAPSAPDSATAAVLNQVKSRPSAILSHGRRTSALFEGDRLDSKHSTQTFGVTPDTVTLNADGFPVVAGLASSLSTVATFPSMTSVPGAPKSKIEKPLPEPPDERMRANYWMECILEVDISASSAQWWRIMKAAVFDERFDGKYYRSRLAVCFRDLVVVHIFDIAYNSQARRFQATSWL
ncbi:hypothetical protein NMY22_g8751 [Coprinellus aureogranulatus]|nr:hypothetical protein NMY22_g8751 [Coprinellus aureogranulatus]